MFQECMDGEQYSSVKLAVRDNDGQMCPNKSTENCQSVSEFAGEARNISVSLHGSSRPTMTKQRF